MNDFSKIPPVTERTFAETLKQERCKLLLKKVGIAEILGVDVKHSSSIGALQYCSERQRCTKDLQFFRMTPKELGLDEYTTSTTNDRHAVLHRFRLKQPRQDGLLTTIKPYRYDIALSYAGEDRMYAETLVTILKACGARVFFDLYEKSTLWGRTFTCTSQISTRTRPKYCVMFLSQHYATKLWHIYEREAAQARAFKERQVYILPIRLGDTEVSGILYTTAYIHRHQETLESITAAIMDKLKQEKSRS